MNQRKEIQQENKMGTQKMLPLIAAMVLPPMLSMLIQSLYNIIDSIFVARLSEAALSAVSIMYPLQNLTLSIAVGTGVGLNAYMARSFGAGDSKRGTNACVMGFLLTGMHYVIIAGFGMLIMHPFVKFFTNDATVAGYCYDYGYIVMIFCVGQLFHITIEKIFQATGKMLVPMLLQAVGCVVNIVLDPILIFGLCGMPALGVKGAAIATVIGQMTSCLIGVILFIKGKSGIHLEIRKGIFIEAEMAKQIYAVGIPSTLIMAFPSLLVAGLNGILISFSTLAVTVFGIYYKLQTFVYMPTMGLIQGIRPIVAFNYGAGNIKREKEAIRISLTIVGMIMLIGTALFWGLPNAILDIFKADEEMKRMGVVALRIISIGFLPSAVGSIASAVFEAMGQGHKSLLVTMLRQLVIILPVAFLFSRIFGLSAVWTAFPIAETTAAVVAYKLLKRELQN